MNAVVHAVGPSSRAAVSRARSDVAAHGGSKVPQLLLLFWIIKIAATTLGETGGDAASMSLHLGYWLSSLLFVAILALLVLAQIRARSLHPALYWSVIVATTTAGTTMADYCDRSLGIGYAGGSLLLGGAVLLVFAAWRLTLGRIDASRITSPGQEAFYWAAILASNTLGTALGDWTADRGGLGYEGGALLFGTILLVVAIVMLTTSISRILLFWAAFVLTRPLGATLGDLLTKPHAHGGLALNRFSASSLLAAVMIGCVLLYPKSRPHRPS
jgi:uncharacterized membrane-anchored protein